MTKFVKVLCAVLALCLLFCGCNASPREQTVTCGELVLTLPASYIDLSDQEYAKGFPLVYGFENEAVLALRRTIRTSMQKNTQCCLWRPTPLTARWASWVSWSPSPMQQTQRKQRLPTCAVSLCRKKTSGVSSFTAPQRTLQTIRKDLWGICKKFRCRTH